MLFTIYRQMPLKILQLCAVSAVCFIFGAGCLIIDENFEGIRGLIVSPLQKDGIIEFTLLNTKSEELAIQIDTIIVHDRLTKEVVWDVSTVDRSEWYKKIGDWFVLKDPDALPKVQSDLLSQIVFGQIPPGFVQLTPMNNQQPILKEGHSYYLGVIGTDGHMGRTEFSVN